MGKAQGDFEKTVLEIIKEHFPACNLSTIQRKLSKDNNYLSLSITVHPESQQALDEVYRALSSNKLVLMAL